MQDIDRRWCHQWLSLFRDSCHSHVCVLEGLSFCDRHMLSQKGEKRDRTWNQWRPVKFSILSLKQYEFCHLLLIFLVLICCPHLFAQSTVIRQDSCQRSPHVTNLGDVFHVFWFHMSVKREVDGKRVLNERITSKRQEVKWCTTVTSFLNLSMQKTFHGNGQWFLLTIEENHDALVVVSTDSAHLCTNRILSVSLLKFCRSSDFCLPFAVLDVKNNQEVNRETFMTETSLSLYCYVFPVSCH